MWTVLRILVLVFITFTVFRYVLLLRKIESVSMLPTFREGSIHVINRLAYSPENPPARGDVVAVRTSGETVLYVKRVVGLPGEAVEIRYGTVYIDGKALEEPYVRLRRRPWRWPTSPPQPRKLPENHYFIIGDNRSMNQEQHEFGVVDGQRIIGKVIR